MSETICTGKEACSVCGSLAWQEAHYTQRLICDACWREIARAKGKSQPAQLSLALPQATKPQTMPVRGPKLLTAGQVWGDFEPSDSPEMSRELP
ncbi:MAG: hypothetical protein ABSB49_09825 [Polyangia bacterium]|jgi:hypothetical protein